MAVRFRIVHVDHSGNTISVHYPVGGTLTWSFQASNVADISYQLPLSDSAIIRDGFGPYYADWRLGINVNDSGWQTLHAGIITSVNMVSDDDAITFRGLDWAHWLEQPVWFELYEFQINDLIGEDEAFRTLVKEYSKGIDDTVSSGFVDGLAAKVWFPPATQADIITHIINTLDRGPSYVNITPVFHGGENEIPGPYQIVVQDETTVLEHINNVCAMDDPFGFDWTMTWDKQMHFFGPRKNVASSPSPIWVINESTDPFPIQTIDWTNNGPLATYITGLGPGTPAIWRTRYHTPSMSTFRQWHKIVRVGGSYLRTVDQVRYLTSGLRYIAPQKDLRVTILPELVNPSNPGDGFQNHIGDVVRITYDFPNYHQIDAYFWITAQEFYGDAAGNWYCDLGLQQIYV